MSDVTIHWLGLSVPAGVEHVRCWGARAISRVETTKIAAVKRKGKVIGYQSRTTDELLRDRQSYRSNDPTESDAARMAFVTWLDDHAIRSLDTLADAAGLGPDEDREIALDAGRYHLRANPRKSYGDLDIVAREDRR